jgi:hypothetical protein
VIPEGLSNRMADNVEPLLAIADAAGAAWGLSARQAFAQLAAIDTDNLSTGASLLRDVLAIFDRHELGQLPSKTILDELASDEFSAWPTFDHGRPITAKQLSRHLRNYGIQVKALRDGSTTFKGYLRGPIAEAASRYVPPGVAQATGNIGNAVTAGANSGGTSTATVADVSLVTDVTDLPRAAAKEAYLAASRGA